MHTGLGDIRLIEAARSKDFAASTSFDSMSTSLDGPPMVAGSKKRDKGAVAGNSSEIPFKEPASELRTRRSASRAPQSESTAAELRAQRDQEYEQAAAEIAAKTKAFGGLCWWCHQLCASGPSMHDPNICVFCEHPDMEDFKEKQPRVIARLSKAESAKATRIGAKKSEA